MQSDIPSELHPSHPSDDALALSEGSESSALPAPGSTPPSGRVVVAFNDVSSIAPDDKTVITQRHTGVEAPPPLLASYQHIGETLIGKQLDHYELIEFVGGGGMGAVFRANDMRLGRTVAVKVLSRDQSDEETIRRFRNEAQSAARLDHPNIARAYFVGEANGWNYIVFEFIEGINLRDLVDERGPLSLEDALSYTLQIAEALAHSSSRDVVHRDIKPSNVLVTAGGQAKLVDMGLARLHQVESSSDDLTASGVTLGTFDYISPEQARDPRAADVRSDIYSLGCTLFYLLAGQPPFPEGTALQKLLRHNDEERPDVRQFRPDLHPSVTSLLAKMLAKRPSQRHQTPSELIADLTLLGQELNLPAIARRGHALLPAAGDPHPWRTSAWQIVAAVAVLALAVVIVDALLSAGEKQADLRPRPKLIASSVPNQSGEPATSPDEPSSVVPATPTKVKPPIVAATTPSVPLTGQGAGAAKAVSAAAPEVAPVEDTAQVANDSADAVSLPEQGFAILPPPVAAGVNAAPIAVAVGGGAEHSAALSLPPLPRKINRLIVAQQTPAVPPLDVEYVASLAAACRRAAELGLNEIELQWNGRQVEMPLEISFPRLTLRAGVGYRPIVVFRPQLTGLESDRQMIRLAGGSASKLFIQGCELRLELPTEPSFGWSLLTMQTGQQLELADCVLTVENVDERHDQVAMIDVRARRPSDTMTAGDPQPSMASPTRLSLDRCIARGAASVIGMKEETPLAVRWNQGLIVTPWRFIATGGSVTNPTRFEDIAINLIHVTAICRQGLYQMERRPGSGYQLSVEVVADHCILVTDADAPLYEFIGVSDVLAGDLHFDGQDNLYPHLEAVFLRYRSGQPGDRPAEFALKQRGLLWSDERNPQTGEPWRQSLNLSLPAHARTKNDFEIDAAMPIEAGFDSAQLPETIATRQPSVETPVEGPGKPTSEPATPASSPD